MNTPCSQSENELADLLDSALRDSRDVPAFRLADWRKAHPQLNDEDVTLLDMLLELSQAVEVWQNVDVQAEIDDDADVPGAATLLLRRNSGRIGRYQLRKHVGSGSMGDVYEAHDPQLDRCVAVKVPRCDRMSRNRGMFTERFVREARAAAAVRHAHICPIYDAGETDGQPYVVMAFVEGESLDAVLSRGRIDDVRTSVQIAVQVADALSAIHQHGIIHRDLKPGNILIDRSGQALLTDFGLALSGMNTERITSDGLIIGTPVYMPPEQAAGENSKLTPAADIYSLGIVLYEMLTGQPPFRGPLQELLREIILRVPSSPIELRPDLDPQLSMIVDKAIAKAPCNRYSSAGEMAESLREWLGSTTSGVAPGPLNAATVISPIRRWKQSALIVIATCIIVVVASLSFRNGSSKKYEIAAKTDGLSAGPAAKAHFGVPDTLAAGAGVLVAAPLELKGKLDITISSNPDQGLRIKDRISATEPGALPLQTGEIVRFEVDLNQPAYVYLLWVSPDGSVVPLYPWDAEHFTGWEAPKVAGSGRAIDHVTIPTSPNRGFEAVEPLGLQTVVLLARRQPLDERVDLAQLLDGLPTTPMLAMNATPGPILRGIKTGQTKATDDAQFDELTTRLGAHFELMRVMSFPQISAQAGLGRQSERGSVEP
ncbi:MAG: serine/threonine-protein kinase [Planctomycetaceae bacterium]